MIHRRDQFRAERILQDRLQKNPKIEVIWDTVVEEIRGTHEPKSVTSIALKNIKTGETSDRPVDGVFIAIGHAPATELFKGQLAMSGSGYITTEPNSTTTDIPGVFAAGDVTDEIYRQAVTAAGLGCMAALDAERFLAENETTTAAAAE